MTPDRTALRVGRSLGSVGRVDLVALLGFSVLNKTSTADNGLTD